MIKPPSAKQMKLFLLAALTSTLLVPFSPEANVAQASTTTGRVSSVIDGDTVGVKLNGKIKKVRLIGMDSPEWTSKKQCYGNYATARAKKLLSGKKVKVITDKTQGKHDKYGRLLAYIKYDGSKDFGKAMIAGGFAKEYTYKKKYANQSSYKSAQTKAKKDRKGMWSKKCNYYKPAKKVAKGVVKMSRTKICHAPGTKYYKQTKNYKSYKDLKSCLKAGGRLPKK